MLGKARVSLDEGLARAGQVPPTCRPSTPDRCHPTVITRWHVSGVMPPTRNDLDDHLEELLDELEHLVDVENVPVSTASRLADRLDRDRRRVHEDLEDLALLDRASSLSVGARARVWWPTPHPWRLEDRHTAESTPRIDHTPDHEPHDTPTTRDVEPPSSHRSLEELAEAVDVPGQTERKEQQRHEALVVVLEAIREAGEIEAGELRELYDDHPAEYGSAASWWKNCMQLALGDVAELDDRLEAADYSGVWRWHD